MSIRSAMNDTKISQTEWDRIFGDTKEKSEIKLFSIWEYNDIVYVVMQNNVTLSHFNKQNGTKFIVYTDLDGNSFCTSESSFLEKFTLRDDVENPFEFLMKGKQ